MTGNKTPRPWKLQAVQSAKDRKWYLRLSGGNGEIVMRSKGFGTAEQANQLAEDIRQAHIIVLPTPQDNVLSYLWKMQPVESNKDKLFYNRLTSGDGQIVMWSEGYPRVDSARRACERTRDAMVVIQPPYGLRR